MEEANEIQKRSENINYRRARWFLVIMALGVSIFAIPYIMVFWNNLAIILVIIGLGIFSLGLSLFIYYIDRYFQDISQKDVEKVEDFVHEWEMRRYGGRKF